MDKRGERVEDMKGGSGEDRERVVKIGRERGEDRKGDESEDRKGIERGRGEEGKGEIV